MPLLAALIGLAAAANVTTSKISVNPVLPAGGVDLQTPAPSSGSTYVKSGDLATFGWNYTSVVNTPPAINVEVTCKQNKQLYTLAQNMSVETSSIVWDTGRAAESGELHLITAEYTMIIYDASKSPEDVAEAGDLAAFDYVFGVYVPQKYSPWPFAAKYVNKSIRIAPPAVLTVILTALAALFAFLI